MSTCRGCGAEIIWLKTKTGKNMCCDPELHFGVDRPGTIVTEDGDVIKGAEDGQDGYTPHWSTCSQAGKFKKK